MADSGEDADYRESSADFRSDHSGSSGSGGDGGSRSRSRYRRGRRRSPSRSRSRSGSRGRSRSRRTEPCVAAVEEAKLLMESEVIKFCDIHRLDLQVTDCVKCRLVSRSVGRSVLPELIRLMRAKDGADSGIPSAAGRYADRLDAKSPTLSFSVVDLSLAVSVFGKGKKVPPALFEDLTKEFLFLPQVQNGVLTKAIRLEKMFLKFRRTGTTPISSSMWSLLQGQRDQGHEVFKSSVQQECLTAQAVRWVSFETKSMKSVKALCTRNV